MSEYNDSNSDVKLIGSPPGYVGYDEGGQLTDAIRNKPFSIILFDEIEKAHPKIFDKFLQILDDGRLTDGRGETVYFSQALIIFTSNLGIYKEDEYGNKIPNVDFNDDYKVIVEKIQAEIKTFFTNKLGRPEIFNRFGDNFVVFNFIKNEVAKQILSKNLKIITKNLKKQFDIELIFDDVFLNEFLKECVADNLDMGGRGIINRLETHIKNGLANFIPKNLDKKKIVVKVLDKSVVFE
jgi:ATP-dependent Clp protease ATP-binding subunit ClpA